MTEKSDTLGLCAKLRVSLAAASPWQRRAIACVAGSASVLAFAPVFAWPVLFITLPLIVWLIDVSDGWKDAAHSGWWFGFGYFFFGLFWIGEAFLVEAEKFAWLLPVAVTLLPAGLALFWAAAAGAARLYWPQGIARVFVFAVLVATAEWLRGHILTGLPWNLLGYALTYPLSLMQSAALFGAYGLTALAALIFPMPLVFLGDRGGKPLWPDIVKAVALAAVPIGLLFGYGAWRLSAPQAVVPGVKLRIVQPSVPQREKWMAEHQRRIFQDHLDLTLTKPQGARDDLQSITHVVWPEAAMPFLPLEHPEAMQAIASVLPPGRQLITGALRREATAADGTPLPLLEHKLYNGILVFNDAGELTARYDKIHLVPFGEYLPADPVLSAIGLKKLTYGRGAFSEGTSPRPMLSIPGLPPALGLVCYEVLFPGEIVQTVDRPAVLINVTNDGWFGNTTGPRQHFHQARVRAVEEGLPIVRAANNGISAVIDGYGRALHTIGLNERGTVDSDLPTAAAPTLYARLGDVLLVPLLLGFLAVAAVLRKPLH